MKNRKTIQKINETKSQLFGEINKINNPLASRTKREETNYSNRKERAKSLDKSFNERISKSVYPYNCILYSNRTEQIYLCLKVIEGHKKKQSQFCPVNFKKTTKIFTKIFYHFPKSPKIIYIYFLKFLPIGLSSCFAMPSIQ